MLEVGYHRSVERRPDWGQVEALRSAAAQVAVAVETARLYEETRHHAEQLELSADISEAMLGAARARLPPSYRAIVTDGQALALRDASFDAVVCQLGLMFFPDPARGLAEFRRVLRSGRCAAACVNSTPDKAPMWGPLASALGLRLPDQRNEFQLWFSLGDAMRLEQMFVAAGFRDVRVERETRDGIIGSFDEYWDAI